MEQCARIQYSVGNVPQKMLFFAIECSFFHARARFVKETLKQKVIHNTLRIS